MSPCPWEPCPGRDREGDSIGHPSAPDLRFFTWAPSSPCRNACMEFLWNNPVVWCPQGCFCCDCPCSWVMLLDPSRLSMLLHRMNYRGNVLQTHLAMEITSFGLGSVKFLCLRIFRTRPRDLTGVLPPCAQFPIHSEWEDCRLVCGQRNCEGLVMSAEGSSGIILQSWMNWQGPSGSTKGLGGPGRPLLTGTWQCHSCAQGGCGGQPRKVGIFWVP